MGGAWVVEAYPSRTIATMDLPIGWRVGPSPRRHGAVRTKARAALQQLEDVLESAFESEWLAMTMALAFVPSSGAIVLSSQEQACLRKRAKLASALASCAIFGRCSILARPVRLGEA